LEDIVKKNLVSLAVLGFVFISMVVVFKVTNGTTGQVSGSSLDDPVVTCDWASGASGYDDLDNDDPEDTSDDLVDVTTTDFRCEMGASDCSWSYSDTAVINSGPHRGATSILVNGQARVSCTNSVSSNCKSVQVISGISLGGTVRARATECGDCPVAQASLACLAGAGVDFNVSLDSPPGNDSVATLEMPGTSAPQTVRIYLESFTDVQLVAGRERESFVGPHPAHHSSVFADSTVTVHQSGVDPVNYEHSAAGPFDYLASVESFTQNSSQEPTLYHFYVDSFLELGHSTYADCDIGPMIGSFGRAIAALTVCVGDPDPVKIIVIPPPIDPICWTEPSSGCEFCIDDGDYTYDCPDGGSGGGQIDEEDEDDWMQGCPDGNVTVPLQTFSMTGGMPRTMAGLLSPRLAPACTGSGVVFISGAGVRQTGGGPGPCPPNVPCYQLGMTD
jgi:hypothetical protein